jgi:outer membrane immunogenic protein
MLCKGLLLSGVALLVASTSAFSADVKLVRKAPPPAVAAPLPPVWAGFYAGPTLGWAGGNSTGYYQGTTPGTTTPPTPANTLPTPAPAPGVASAPGSTSTADIREYERCHAPYSTVLQRNARAQEIFQTYGIECWLDPITPGALAGYNFQFGSIVAGIEGDVGWIGVHSPIIFAPDGSKRYDQFGVTWTSHLRGRVGYAFGQYLPYFAGGVALAGYNVAHFRSDDTGSVLWTANDTRVGYTIGGGVEIANLFPSFLPGWVFRAEYLYDHFNPKQYDWVPGMRYTVSDLTMHTARAAATYRFSGPR